MAPTLILDKSSLQSLNAETTQEFPRYFFMVVPPILLEEILGDLSKNTNGKKDPKALVANLAQKVPITNSAPSPNFRMLCIQDLLGNSIPMDDRRPILNKADAVFGEGESFAVSHPEKSAIDRWRKMQFNDSDQQFADALRERGHGTDWDALLRTAPKLEFSATTFQELRAEFDGLLDMPEGQPRFLQFFLPMIGCGPQTSSEIFARWEKTNNMSLREFAPYATHCLRIHLLFLFGMGMDLVRKKRSNIIDIEYLCYLPFAHVFSSGDNCQKQFVPSFHAGDQSFVTRDDLVASLNEIASARKSNKDATPGEDSLITKLWRKHCNRPPQPSDTIQPQSEEEINALREKSKPLLDALEKRRRDDGPQPRFPK